MMIEVGATQPADPAMQRTRFGAVIIGDEILSGKRQDKHLSRLIQVLGERGLSLAWARYLGDDQGPLVSALTDSFASGDVVFSFGGIGATPDDRTRQAAAQALGLPLVLHPQAAALITQRCAEMAAEGKGSADMGLPENRQRLKMGEFPEGAAIIPNPYNRIPGFSIAHHWFVPGFPVMAWPMVDWVLDTHYRDQFHREARADRSLLAYELAESTVTPLLESIAAQFPAVAVYSLPSVGDDGRRRHVELGVKGPADAVQAAWPILRAGVIALGGPIEDTP